SRRKPSLSRLAAPAGKTRAHAGMRGHGKGRGRSRALQASKRIARAQRTSNSRVCTTLPSSEISTLYLPVGQPLGLLIWKSVTPSPVKVTSLLSSLTVWLLSTWVHFAPSLAGTEAIGSEVAVATAAWMVSFGLKVVIGAVTRMSAPTALPRSTAVTEAVAGIGAGGSAIGAGSLATGGGAGSSFFLQPTSATLPSRTASTLMCRRLRLFISDFL